MLHEAQYPESKHKDQHEGYSCLQRIKHRRKGGVGGRTHQRARICTFLKVLERRNDDVRVAERYPVAEIAPDSVKGIKKGRLLRRVRDKEVTARLFKIADRIVKEGRGGEMAVCGRRRRSPPPKLNMPLGNGAKAGALLLIVKLMTDPVMSKFVEVFATSRSAYHTLELGPCGVRNW